MFGKEKSSAGKAKKIKNYFIGFRIRNFAGLPVNFVLKINNLLNSDWKYENCDTESY